MDPRPLPPALLLGRRDVAALLDLDELIAAVEGAFLSQARGEARGPAVASLDAGPGTFHAKGAGLGGVAPRAAFKVNGNFPGNPERYGLPTIQGVIVLADAANGAVLAILDSIEITALRTAAVTAVAARRLVAPGVRRALIVGCGVQGRAHARALPRVLSGAELLVYDVVPERGAALAERLDGDSGLACRAVEDLEEGVRTSQVVVTCTTAARPFLSADLVAQGALVAAVGADNPRKQELDPRLMARARVVVDDLEQCAEGGELRHALAAGLLHREDVAATLADVVAGRRPGRAAASDIVVFDSTGVAIADLAAAGMVYERGRARGAGSWIDLG
ncbi:MAG TPA: ornithine cyclodeaminase family protein [Thermoanaerobaculia bacterium]|nr:ornithine cyclodeaminase family protein [Thermoanaerobaculia bacterium]